MYKIAKHTTTPRAPRTKTPEQALVALMRQCAKAEKCSHDALGSMRRWGLSEEDARGVLERLERERFIDDGRYASAYVREKMRFSGWGARKIAAALRAKRIDAALIEEALGQLTPEDDTSRLESVLSKKAQTTSYKNLYDLKGKLVRFGLSRGFDLEDVLEVTERVLRAREP